MESLGGWLLRGRFWSVKAGLLGVVCVLLFSATPAIWHPTYEWGSWEGYCEKYEDPLKDMAVGRDPKCHESKLTARLVVPALAKVLGFRRKGTLLLSALSNILLLAMVASWVAREFGGRRDLGCWMAVLFGGLHVSTIAWAPVAGYFDAVAITLSVAVLNVRPWLGKALLASVAMWTDERAILSLWAVATILAIPWMLGSVRLGRAVIGASAVCAGVVLYGVSRVALARFAGWTVSTGGVGVTALSVNLSNFLPFALWEVFEGGWTIVGLSTLVLWRGGRGWNGLLWVGVLGASLLAASVHDLARSMCYIVPFLLVPVRILAKSDGELTFRRWIPWVAVASLLIQNYEIVTFEKPHRDGWQAAFVYWRRPTPVSVVEDAIVRFSRGGERSGAR